MHIYKEKIQRAYDFVRAYTQTHKKRSIGGALVIGVVLLLAITGGPKVSESGFLVITREDVSRQVEATGRIESAKELDLAIQSGGIVSSVPVSVGQEVSAGQLLVSTNTADLQVKLKKQQAALEKLKLLLANEEPRTNAIDDLAQSYDDGFNAVSDAFLDLPGAITGVDDILAHSYLSDNTIRTSFGDKARDFRETAETAYYKAEEVYEDVQKVYRTASRASDTATIERLIIDTYDALKVASDAVKSTKNFVDYIENEIDEEDRSDELVEDQESLDTYTEEINTHLSELLTIKNTIKESKEGVVDERYDIESIKIDIRQTELDIQDTRVQIGNRIIFAPISGVITKVETEVGETISSGTVAVSMMSLNQFQIEAKINEANIDEIVLGQPVVFTLDSLGKTEKLNGTVAHIDPGATIEDGIVNYKIKIALTEVNPVIKSGMNADIVITTYTATGVVAIPKAAIKEKDGEAMVQVVTDTQKGETEERRVLLGETVDGNRVIVIDGLEEGDTILIKYE